MVKKIKLLSQYIKDLSFENYAAQKRKFSNEEPEIHIDIKIKKKNLLNGPLEVTLLILLEAKNKSEKLFLLELSYAATFAINRPDNSNQNKRISFVDCPNIMFPFVQQIIFSITQTSGFPPLTLDYIDFEDLFNSKIIN